MAPISRRIFLALGASLLAAPLAAEPQPAKLVMLLLMGPSTLGRPPLAAEAVRANPSVIFAVGPDAPRAAQQATSIIPIVMIASTDPRVMGVDSLAHPGGNLTGMTIGQPEVASESGPSSLRRPCPP